MNRQRGAALLLAMLTVALVATLAAAALWQQWRAAEVEAAERQRLQAGWVLVGALDWARLILREDARSNQNSGTADYLGEPWSTPLEEARLSSFLAADKNNSAEELMPAFLSGHMVDLQSRLNFRNLIKTSGTGAQAKAEISTADLASFMRLFSLLNLPASELNTAAAHLLRTTERAMNDPKPSDSPLLPQRYAQLRWLGLSERTLLNLNTASAEALSASIPGLDLALAQQVVGARAAMPFNDLRNAIDRIPGTSDKTITSQSHDVRSRFFEVHTRLRLDDTLIEEHALVQRNGLSTLVRWRERVPSSS